MAPFESSTLYIGHGTCSLGRQHIIPRDPRAELCLFGAGPREFVGVLGHASARRVMPHVLRASQHVDKRS